MVFSTGSRGLFRYGLSLLVLVRAKRAQGNLQETILPNVIGKHEKQKYGCRWVVFTRQVGRQVHSVVERRHMVPPGTAPVTVQEEALRLKRGGRLHPARPDWCPPSVWPGVSLASDVDPFANDSMVGNAVLPIAHDLGHYGIGAAGERQVQM